jgi:hypothetical protein
MTIVEKYKDIFKSFEAPLIPTLEEQLAKEFAFPLSVVVWTFHFSLVTSRRLLSSERPESFLTFA